MDTTPMETVRSRDGTRIAFRRTGSGPPLVLVHGAAGDHGRWEVAGVRAALARHLTVVAMDRRGRGGSGDTEPWALAREFEDVAAVVDGVGEPSVLLGHSFGALCALEASLLSHNIRRLILYEPPIPTPGEPLVVEGATRRVQELLDSGDREGALVHFLREVADLTAGEVEALRAAPGWQGRIRAAHTLPREEWAVAAYRFEPGRFREVTPPALLLEGGESAPGYRKATRAVHQALARSRVLTFEGQQHVAMNTDPERFVAEVLEFALSPD